MNYIFWNVRSLESGVKRRGVRQICVAHRPDILCLNETKIKEFTQLTLRQIGTKRIYGLLRMERGIGGIIMGYNTEIYELMET